MSDRRNAEKCSAAALAALLVMTSACQTVTPPRPRGVPAEAFWSGGPDGGVFVRLFREPADSSIVVRAEVYSDSTGAPLYRGPLTLEPASGTLPILHDPRLYAGWDGQGLHLTDGRQLKIASLKSVRSK